MSTVELNRLGAAELDARLVLGQKFYLLGQCNLKVLSGTVEVMGFRMEAHMPPLQICSPKSLSLTSVVAVSGEAVIKLTSVTNNLVAIERMQAAFQDILSFSRERAEDITGCWVIQSPHDDLRFFEPGNRWDPIACEVAPSTRQVVFVCGNRKVGKSTFCRYLVNRMLNYHPNVAFFDFDCGQAEFTPPGFVAYSVRNAPFAAPNFATISTPPTDSRFYGSMTPSDDPRRYLECCMDLWSSFAGNLQTGVPVVINMLGWVSGLGLALHSHLLHNLKPTHILAFGEDPPAGEDYVSKALYSKSGFPGDQDFDQQTQPAIAYIPSVSSPSSLKMSPADSRSLSFWSYFFYNQSTSQFDFGTPLSRKQPFAISTSSISIQFQSNLPSVGFWPSLNCSLVALVSDPDFTPGSVLYRHKKVHRNIVGLGLVRGVNPKDKTIHLVTPVPLEALSLCNTLLVGTFQLPPALFTHGHQYDGPYLSFMANFETTGGAPRKVRHNIVRNRQ